MGKNWKKVIFYQNCGKTALRYPVRERFTVEQVNKAAASVAFFIFYQLGLPSNKECPGNAVNVFFSAVDIVLRLLR